MSLTAADGVRISAMHDPAASGGADLCFVVAHGFTGSWRRPDVGRIVRILTGFGGVVSFDFRGHGGSEGASTVGDLEVLDVAAAVGWARELGYRRVVTLGWSMGGGVVLRHAALHRDEDACAGEVDERTGVDGVVAVSAPSRWNYRGTWPMRLVHVGVGTRPGRAVLARAYGTRIAATGWEPRPEPPDALAGRIAPTPVLVVHGDRDHYFPLEHARWLARAAGPAAQLWVEPGFAHAESAATPDLVARIAQWAVTVTSITRTSARMPG